MPKQITFQSSTLSMSAPPSLVCVLEALPDAGGNRRAKKEQKSGLTSGSQSRKSSGTETGNYQISGRIAAVSIFPLLFYPLIPLHPTRLQHAHKARRGVRYTNKSGQSLNPDHFLKIIKLCSSYASFSPFGSCFRFLFAVESISLIRLSWLTSEAPGS